MKSSEEQLEMAIKLAHSVHDNQTRRITGESYFNHPLRVSESFSDIKLKIISFLHDVVEDGNVTFNGLRAYGFSEDIVDAVSKLTRWKDETYFDFIFRIKSNPLAVQVKIADIKDNMTNLDEHSLKDKYRLAKFILQHNFIRNEFFKEEIDNE